MQGLMSVRKEKLQRGNIQVVVTIKNEKAVKILA
jgi:hypothetical protein